MTNQPIHIVLDLETWGTQPGDDLRSIGACVIDPYTGYVARDRETTSNAGQVFYIAVDNPLERSHCSGPVPAGYHWDGVDACRRYPLRRDPNTVKWWSEQSAEAQAAFADPVDLRDGLHQFAEWLCGIAAGMERPNGEASNVRIWAHGANFDPGMISAAFRAVGLPDVIHYRSPRDTRTIFEAAGMDPATCLNDFTTPDMVYHHALHDAIVEGRAICEAYRRLGLQDPLMRQATPVTVLEDLRNALRFYAPQHLWDDLHDDQHAAAFDRNVGSVLGDDQGAVARSVLQGLGCPVVQSLNLNDNVRVKLNDIGRAVARAASMTIEEDADGFSTWQLWHLMHTYGANLYNGCALPFETATIETC